MNGIGRDILGMAGGGEPMMNTGIEGMGADPELIQQLKQMIATADPQELQMLMQMPPEQLVEFFIKQGLEQEDAEEAVQILTMMLGGGGQQPPPQQAPPQGQQMPQGG